MEALEDSLSINFSLISTTWADLAADAVRQLLWQQAPWRATVALPWRPPSDDTSVAAATATAGGGGAGGGAGAGAAASQQVDLAAVHKSLREEMLPLLRVAVEAITPQDLLPAGLVMPQARILCLSNESAVTDAIAGSDEANGVIQVQQSCTQRHPPSPTVMTCWLSCTHQASTKLRRNPLAVMLTQKDMVAGAEDSDEDDDDDAEEDADEEQPSERTPAGHTTFTVHVNFGNDTMESQLRSVIHVRVTLRTPSAPIQPRLTLHCTFPTSGTNSWRCLHRAVQSRQGTHLRLGSTSPVLCHRLCQESIIGRLRVAVTAALAGACASVCWLL